MRLPWGYLPDIYNLFLKGSEYNLVGCLSAEPRCCAVPELMAKNSGLNIELLEIRDPADAFPNYSAETAEAIKRNTNRLKEAGVNFIPYVGDLLASHDEILEIGNRCIQNNRTLILDITSMPKRYFCLLVKRVLLSSSCRNVIVTYTDAGKNSYATEHLAEDALSCACLPGYAAPLPPEAEALVISIGFESLGLRSLLETYRNSRKVVKIILSFPPNSNVIQRQWRTLMDLLEGDPSQILDTNLKVISLWDIEEVYKTLSLWSESSNCLAFAPFGPKPHSLSMALFAIKNDCGLYYTQPKSYNPNYTKGQGDIWAYVIKWDGIPCFDRHQEII